MDKHAEELLKELQEHGHYNFIQKHVDDPIAAELIDSLLRTAVCSLSPEFYVSWREAAILNWQSEMDQTKKPN